MPPRILLVEDEAGLALTLSDRLRSENYDVEAVEDGEAGMRRARAGGFDLILLDWMLPKRSGVDVCRDLRQAGIQIPILMLTARGQVVDKVVGLKLGADDYLTKPFEMPELLARIEALLRRASMPDRDDAGIQIGTISVDLKKMQVRRNGEMIDLTPREYKLLCYFLNHRGRAITREELLREVWAYRFIPSTRTVDVHVGALRQKLEEDPKEPRLIRTVSGEGYRFGD